MWVVKLDQVLKKTVFHLAEEEPSVLLSLQSRVKFQLRKEEQLSGTKACNSFYSWLHDKYVGLIKPFIHSSKSWSSKVYKVGM